MLFNVLIIKNDELIGSETLPDATFAIAVANWNKQNADRQLSIEKANFINLDGSGGSFEVGGTVYQFQKVS